MKLFLQFIIKWTTKMTHQSVEQKIQWLNEQGVKSLLPWCSAYSFAKSYFKQHWVKEMDFYQYSSLVYSLLWNHKAPQMLQDLS